MRLVGFSLLLFFSACVGGPGEDGPGPSVRATIQIKGSDTMINLALAWAERYQTVEPGVRLAVTGGGSGTGIAAMINGTADMANASRSMKPQEFEAAQENGITPVEHVVAADAIALVVHPSNPVERLTLQQISDLYTGSLNNWNQVGGNDLSVVLLSRESNSGTHVFFLEEVIRLGEKDSRALFSPETLLLPSSQGITTEVRQNPHALGYDGLGYVTAEEKIVAVGRDAAGPFVLPGIDTVNAGTYPIARPLFIYTAGEPQGQIKAYLNWIVGPEAQAIVADLGFVPVARPGTASLLFLSFGA